MTFPSLPSFRFVFISPFLASAQPEQVRLCPRLGEMVEFHSSFSTFASRRSIVRTSSDLRSPYRKRLSSTVVFPPRHSPNNRLCARLNEMILSIYLTAATPSDRRPSSPPVGDTRLRAFSQQRNPAARTTERVSMRRTIRLSCDNRIVPIRPQGRTISHRKPRRRGLRSGSRRTSRTLRSTSP